MASSTIQPARRATGLGLMLAVHVLLVGCWLLARPHVPVQPDGSRSAIQWIDLPALPRPVAPMPAPRATARATPRAPSVIVAPAQPERVAPAPAVALEPPAPAPAETIMETSRRLAGSVDRAQRQANRPYIVAPLDSPTIRMRNGMQKAHDLAPPKFWEAPKVEELVNQTGDGTRRTRVITSGGAYCITERATNTSIEQIERDGKLRLTNCPQHEDTANPQEWRTARD